jgi:hypothetical protein
MPRSNATAGVLTLGFPTFYGAQGTTGSPLPVYGGDNTNGFFYTWGTTSGGQPTQVALVDASSGAPLGISSNTNLNPAANCWAFLLTAVPYAATKFQLKFTVGAATPTALVVCQMTKYS